MVKPYHKTPAQGIMKFTISENFSFVILTSHDNVCLAHS